MSKNITVRLFSHQTLIAVSIFCREFLLQKTVIRTVSDVMDNHISLDRIEVEGQICSVIYIGSTFAADGGLFWASHSTGKVLGERRKIIGLKLLELSSRLSRLILSQISNVSKGSSKSYQCINWLSTFGFAPKYTRSYVQKFVSQIIWHSKPDRFFNFLQVFFCSNHLGDQFPVLIIGVVFEYQY
jgi:hypothetical protein